MRQDQNKSASRAAYSPAEVAKSCGRHPTWAYRQLYAGKLKAVTGFGRILIPASELERVMATAEPYSPKSKTENEEAADTGALIALNSLLTPKRGAMHRTEKRNNDTEFEGNRQEIRI